MKRGIQVPTHCRKAWNHPEDCSHLVYVVTHTYVLILWSAAFRSQLIAERHETIQKTALILYNCSQQTLLERTNLTEPRNCSSTPKYPPPKKTNKPTNQPTNQPGLQPQARCVAKHPLSSSVNQGFIWLGSSAKAKTRKEFWMGDTWAIRERPSMIIIAPPTFA